VIKSADISPCGLYRYTLMRVWSEEQTIPLIIMLNPSTADAEHDDPTLKSLVRIAKHRGWGGVRVENLYAWRCTDPRELPTPPSMAQGPDNARVLESAIRSSKVVVCAWGANKHAKLKAPAVVGMIGLYHWEAHCLGKTADGSPRHPLYLPADVDMETYREFEHLEHTDDH
jgi:hypothetical protein